MSPASHPVPALLDPSNCVLVLIDFQPQMAFGVKSIDGQLLVNNVTGLAKAAQVFKVPTLLTSVAEKTFSGPTFSQITEVFPQEPIIDRTTMNTWEDKRVVDAIKKTGRKKIVLAGLWTEVCIAFPALDALREGFEVYVVADACGGTSQVAHDLAIQRVAQAGGTPITWLQFLLELQRDWARQETYDPVNAIVKQHGGTYGAGITYAKAMLGASANEGKR
ncbi:hydrolase [Stigmatella erecta]|uniref:Nicotinamidase-related amidase n=1 Tax=Stigmatella erecta TaxID=83460 RepID=A0A1I0AJC3_9BACT|nr:hydrolase [Stigmatella erecta]SES94400.1 Nicotinamidase-related amidase [Stigmatella erecta]